MGTAAAPLEQENDLKEALINTSAMIHGLPGRMLQRGGVGWGGEEDDNCRGGGGGRGGGG